MVKTNNNNKNTRTKVQHVIFPPKVCPLHLSSVGSTVAKPTPPTIIRMTPGNDPLETQTKVLREFPAKPQTDLNTYSGSWFMHH